MGMSRRRMSERIKELITDQPIENINQLAPKISQTVLTRSQLNETFEDDSTIKNSITIISKQFNSLSSKGYKGKSKEELANDVLTQQEFLEMILDEIEEETIISSKILKKALKIVMCKFFNIDFDVYSFAQLLFHEIIFQLLLRDLNDTMKDSYEELAYEQIHSMVLYLTTKIMNETVYSEINKFIDTKCSLKDILNLIYAQTSEAEFGEF